MEKSIPTRQHRVMMKVLVTGGTGYIGSHCAVWLLQQNFEVLLLDNLSNSDSKVCNRIQEITDKEVSFAYGDIGDEKTLKKIFLSHQIDVVLHCAGLKSVRESMQEPERYYQTNVLGTKCLLKVMEQFDVKKNSLTSPKQSFFPLRKLLFVGAHALLNLHII